jgi:hypothetical protein
VLLEQLRLIHHTRNQTVATDLATLALANWTAARATLLARAQATYPDRGYT